jgi:hypothetical protein
MQIFGIDEAIFWNAASAVGSIFSALGTAAAAVIALVIWLRDRADRKDDRDANSRALASLLFGELSTGVMKAQLVYLNLLKLKTIVPSVNEHFAGAPEEFVKGLPLIMEIRTPRLERLIEVLGALPADTTIALTNFLVSLSALEGIYRTLTAPDHDPKNFDAESVEAATDCIKSLHVDARVAYLKLASTLGKSPAQIKKLVADLDAAPN